MMFSDNGKISTRQMQALIVLNTFGVTAIILPRQAAQMAGYGGFIAIALATVIMIAFSRVYGSLCAKFPGKTLVEITICLLGKPLGVALCIGLCAKLIFTWGLMLRVFCEMLKSLALFQTPVGITAAVIVGTAAYAAYKGRECRARVAELLLVVAFIPLFIAFLFSVTRTDFLQLTGVFSEQPFRIIKAAAFLTLSFQGLELSMLSLPFLNNTKKETAKSYHAHIAGAVGLTGVLLTISVVLAMAKFGLPTLLTKQYPLVQMLDTVDVPGSFIERQDIIVLWFVIASVFASINAAIYFSSLILQSIASEGEKAFVVLCALFIWGISILPGSMEACYQFLEWTVLAGGGFYLFVFPLLLLLVAAIRKKGGTIQ